MTELLHLLEEGLRGRIGEVFLGDIIGESTLYRATANAWCNLVRKPSSARASGVLISNMANWDWRRDGCTFRRLVSAAVQAKELPRAYFREAENNRRNALAYCENEGTPTTRSRGWILRSQNTKF
jgi:hypothetical protein